MILDPLHCITCHAVIHVSNYRTLNRFQTEQALVLTSGGVSVRLADEGWIRSTLRWQNTTERTFFLPYNWYILVHDLSQPHASYSYSSSCLASLIDYTCSSVVDTDCPRKDTCNHCTFLLKTPSDKRDFNHVISQNKRLLQY